jgi:hypothetical protein
MKTLKSITVSIVSILLLLTGCTKSDLADAIDKKLSQNQLRSIETTSVLTNLADF